MNHDSRWVTADTRQGPGARGQHEFYHRLQGDQPELRHAAHRQSGAPLAAASPADGHALVGMQSIRPRRGAAKAIIVDWLTFHADRSRYYYGMDTLSSDTPASSSWAWLPQACFRSVMKPVAADVHGNLKGMRRHINTRIEVSASLHFEAMARTSRRPGSSSATSGGGHWSAQDRQGAHSGSPHGAGGEVAINFMEGEVDPAADYRLTLHRHVRRRFSRRLAVNLLGNASALLRARCSSPREQGWSSSPPASPSRRGGLQRVPMRSGAQPTYQHPAFEAHGWQGSANTWTELCDLHAFTWAGPPITRIHHSAHITLHHHHIQTSISI